MTDEQVRMKLLQLIEAEGGSYRKASKRLGYSAPFLGLMVSGKRPIPEPLLRAIGLKRVFHYEEVRC
jgi:hypothetical protein